MVHGATNPSRVSMDVECFFTITKLNVKSYNEFFLIKSTWELEKKPFFVEKNQYLYYKNVLVKLFKLFSQIIYNEFKLFL